MCFLGVPSRDHFDIETDGFGYPVWADTIPRLPDCLSPGP